MPHEIAVFLDAEGKTTNLTGQGKVTVYARRMGKWHSSREMDFSLEDVQDMTDLRIRMQELLAFLLECRILAGSRINGIPAVILDQAKCRVWELEGKPAEFLDYILREEENLWIEINKKKEEMIEIPSFIEMSPGNYTVSVKEIQENNTSLTTKQILLPFLRQGNFSTLEIICNHIPQWIEGEAIANNFTIETLIREENHNTKISLLRCSLLFPGESKIQCLGMRRKSV
ncbi:MAG: nitrogenase [Peptococcaceae bacterium]|nr:nitrogenase [Peptococcaceae bacterium]